MTGPEHVPEELQKAVTAVPIADVAAATPVSAGLGAWPGVPYSMPAQSRPQNRATIMFLQGSAGNQAVTRMVSREPAEAPPRPPPAAAPPPPSAGPPGGGSTAAPPLAAPGAGPTGPTDAPGGTGTPGGAAAPGGPVAAPPPPGGPPPGGPPGGRGPAAKGPTPKVDPSRAPGHENTTPPNQISAGNPSSGFNWDEWWADPNNKMSVARVPLEVLRAYPGYGLLFGGAADALNIYQDFNQISGEDAPFLKGVMAARSAILLINNVIGHIVYVDQFVQDGLTVSVVGVEFTPLSAALNSLLKGVKVYLDTCMIFLDFGIMCGAAYRASNAPPGSQSQKNFLSMFGNYAANTMGSMINFVIDIIDLATGGFSNGEVVKTGVGAINAILKGAVKMGPIIRGILLGWAGIFGGTPLTPAAEPAPATATGGGGGTPAAPPAGGPSPAVARTIQRLVADGTLGGGVGRMGKRAAAEIILMELQQMKNAYTTGDVLLGGASDLMGNMMTQLREFATKANDGQDPFIMARDGASQALADLSVKLGQFAQMEEMSKTAEQYAADVSGMADSALALVDEVRVPDVEIPKAEVGDNAVANAVEGVVNAVGSLAEGGLQALVDQVNTLVDEMKPTVKEPIQEAKDHAGEVGEFMKIVQTEARGMIQWGEAKSQEVSEKLGQCNSFEDFINLMIGQVMQMLGMEGDFKIDDVRAGWAQLGQEIDAAIKWAEELRASAEAGEGEGEEGEGEGTATASAPPATGGSAANGASPAAAPAAPTPPPGAPAPATP